MERLSIPPGTPSPSFFKIGAHSAALRPEFVWRAMEFKVLLRKRGGARAHAARGESFLETRPFDGAFSVYLSCFMTRHTVVELVELSADRSKRRHGD